MQGLSVSDSDPRGPVLFEIGRVGYASAGSDAGTVLQDLAFSRAGACARISAASPSPEPRCHPRWRRCAVCRTEPGAEAGLSDVEMRRLAPTLGNLTLNDLSIDLPSEVAPDPAPRATPGPSRAAPSRREAGRASAKRQIPRLRT